MPPEMKLPIDKKHQEEEYHLTLLHRVKAVLVQIHVYIATNGKPQNSMTVQTKNLNNIQNYLVSSTHLDAIQIQQPCFFSLCVDARGCEKLTGTSNT